MDSCLYFGEMMFVKQLVYLWVKQQRWLSMHLCCEVKIQNIAMVWDVYIYKKKLSDLFTLRRMVCKSSFLSCILFFVICNIKRQRNIQMHHFKINDWWRIRKHKWIKYDVNDLHECWWFFVFNLCCSSSFLLSLAFLQSLCSITVQKCYGIVSKVTMEEARIKVSWLNGWKSVYCFIPILVNVFVKLLGVACTSNHNCGNRNICNYSTKQFFEKRKR